MQPVVQNETHLEEFILTIIFTSLQSMAVDEDRSQMRLRALHVHRQRNLEVNFNECEATDLEIINLMKKSV